MKNDTTTKQLAWAKLLRCSIINRDFYYKEYIVGSDFIYDLYYAHRFIIGSSNKQEILNFVKEYLKNPKKHWIANRIK